MLENEGAPCKSTKLNFSQIMSIKTFFWVCLFHSVFLPCSNGALSLGAVDGIKYGREWILYDVGRSRTMVLSLFQLVLLLHLS